MNNPSLPSSPSTSHAAHPLLSTLSDLASGLSGLVYQLQGGREFNFRLAVLGFTPGARVDVVQNFGRGPMIVAVRGAHLALGRGEAQKVRIQAL